MRERIAHLLADWRRSKDTDDSMVLRVAATMAHHQLEKADAEIEDLRFQLCGTQGELDSALSRERTLLDEQEDCRIEIERLTAERDETQRELRKAETESSMLRIECAVIAADEIERLRAENDGLRRQLDQFVGDFNDEVQREAI